LGQAQAQYLTLTHNILTEFLLLGYVSFCNPNTNISGRPSLPLITAATAACFPTTPTNDLVCLWPKEPHFPHLLNRFYLSVGIKKTPKTIFFPEQPPSKAPSSTASELFPWVQYQIWKVLLSTTAGVIVAAKIIVDHNAFILCWLKVNCPFCRSQG
jgi:hypothetical protein